MKKVHNRWIVSEMQNRDRNGEWIISNMEFISMTESNKDAKLFISSSGCLTAAHNYFHELVDGKIVRSAGTVRISASNQCRSCQFEQMNVERRTAAQRKAFSEDDIKTARIRRRIEILREAREAGLDPSDLL